MAQVITTDDYITDPTGKLVKSKREIITDYIDRVVMSQPRGPERWKAARRMVVELNLSGTPGLTAREEDRLVTEDNARDRELNYLHNKGFDKSQDKNSDLRGTLNMPSSVNLMIKMVDPEAFDKKNLPKLIKTFPDYMVADKY